MKIDLDKLYVDKFLPSRIDLSKLSDYKNDAVKKTEYDELVTRVNAIDTIDFCKPLKTKSINIWLQYQKMCIFDKVDDIDDITIHIIAQ